MRFKKVFVEIGNVCNMDCNFCPKCSRKPQNMKSNEFEEILIKLKPYTKFVYLHVMGEPTLHPNLQDFLEIAKEQEIRVNITTNGTLLEEVQEVLLPAEIIRQINISVHSFEANENSFTLEEYIQGIIQFIKAAQEKSKVIISLRLWNLDSAKFKGANSLNSKIFTLLQEQLQLEENLEEIMEGVSSYKVKDRLYLNMEEKFEWATDNQGTINEKKFCYGLRDHIGILVDGTIVPCCLDNEGNIPLGNIFQDDVAEVLESDRAIQIYEGFSRREAVEELCKKCNFRPL